MYEDIRTLRKTSNKASFVFHVIYFLLWYATHSHTPLRGSRYLPLSKIISYLLASALIDSSIMARAIIRAVRRTFSSVGSFP